MSTLVRTCLGAALALTLSACAETIVMTERDPGVDAMISPLITGFTEIENKALHRVDVEQMIAGGFTGLAVIDDHLSFETTDSRLRIRRGRFSVARIPRADERSIESRVNDIVTVLTLARRASPHLGMASSEVMLKAIFDGATGSLDSYSHYSDRARAQRNLISRSGYIGVGFDVARNADDKIILTVLKDGPAVKAGLMTGDILTSLDDAALPPDLSAIKRALDGTEGAPVTVTILRNGNPQRFTVKRARIVPESVTAQKLGDLLHVKISSFNDRTAASLEEIVTAAGPIRGLILDLRSDPGGLLDQAIRVADLFLNSGTIVTLRGRNPTANQSYSATPGDIIKNVPMVMLMDGLSASSSEILAAALKQNQRAVIVGTASVGKGTVQSLIHLSNGGEFAVTWAQSSGPNGEALDVKGILPDLCTTSPPTRGRQNANDVLAALRREQARKQLNAKPDAGLTARAACRPEPRRDEAVDTEIARLLLTDAELRTALDLPRLTSFVDR